MNPLKDFEEHNYQLKTYYKCLKAWLVEEYLIRWLDVTFSSSAFKAHGHHMCRRKWLPDNGSWPTVIVVDYQVTYDHIVDALLQPGHGASFIIPGTLGRHAGTGSFRASPSAVAGVVSSPARHTRLRLLYDVVWVWESSQPWKLLHVPHRRVGPDVGTAQLSLYIYSIYIPMCQCSFRILGLTCLRMRGREAFYKMSKGQGLTAGQEGKIQTTDAIDNHRRQSSSVFHSLFLYHKRC